MTTQHLITRATVSDIVSSTDRRQIPQVSLDAGMREIVASFKKSRHARLVYVIDENSRLYGIVTGTGLKI